MMELGKLQKVPLREVWKHEARNFTTWLEEHIDELNDQLGFSLTCTGREQPVGNFSVDLVGEDENGDMVIIENQLEKSDHDHLGKLLTYLSNLDAKKAFWIVSEPRSEHINAMVWLNETYSASFYLIKVEGVKIGDSAPAALFTTIVQPSEESRDIGAIKKEGREIHQKRLLFWGELQNNLQGKTNLHSNLKPRKGNWWDASTGVRGISYRYTILKNNTSRVELYIDKGKECEVENLEIFNTLYSHKDEIESAFGEALDWQPIDGQRACRICYDMNDGGLHDEDRWNSIQSNMIDAMVKLEKAIKPHLTAL